MAPDLKFEIIAGGGKGRVYRDLSGACG